MLAQQTALLFAIGFRPMLVRSMSSTSSGVSRSGAQRELEKDGEIWKTEDPSRRTTGMVFPESPSSIGPSWHEQRRILTKRRDHVHVSFN